MIFYLVKDIDEWNILKPKNIIKMKRKMSKIEEENVHHFVYAISNKDFISQEN